MTPHPAELIKRFPTATILVVGDVMLDKTLIGSVTRVAPEAPVPVVHVTQEEYYLGGAANAAANVASLGGKVILIGYLGNDAAGATFKDLCEQSGITCACVITKSPTVQKVRVTSSGQQLVRIDYEEKQVGVGRDDILSVIQTHLGKIHAILLSDYNKGCLTPELVKAVIATGKPIIVDPKPENLSMFAGATLIQPNHLAVEKTTGKALHTEKEVTIAGSELAKRLDSNLLITRAAYGMSLIEKTGSVMHVPTQAREVYDVTGAGDSSIAAAALALAVGGTLREAVILANHTAGIKVGKRGTATVHWRELTYELEAGHTKMKTNEEIQWITDALRAKGKTIVFTNGFFDILHIGHAQLFKRAKSLGDVLVLGLNTDASIRRLKGQGRPLIPQHERAEILSAIEAVDYIVLFDEDTPYELIKQLKPNVLVKGGNLRKDQVVGHDVVEAYGGRVEIMSVDESQHRLDLTTGIEG